MALAATATNIQLHGSANITRPVGASDTIYVRAFSALVSGDHDTAGDRGDVIGWSSASGSIPWGWASNSNESDAVGATPFRYVNLQASDGLITIGQGITASGTEDVGKLLWASDDGTYSFTRAAKNALVGMVAEYRAADEVRALALSPEGHLCARLAREGVFEIPFIVYGSTSGTKTFDWEPDGHCRLESVSMEVIDSLTGGSVALSWVNGSTDITGGASTWDNADVEGTALTVTAVTQNANTIFREGGSALKLKFVATGSAGGALMIRARMRALPGV